MWPLASASAGWGRYLLKGKVEGSSTLLRTACCAILYQRQRLLCNAALQPCIELLHTPAHCMFRKSLLQAASLVQCCALTCSKNPGAGSTARDDHVSFGAEEYRDGLQFIYNKVCFEDKDLQTDSRRVELTISHQGSPPPPPTPSSSTS